MLPEYFAIIGSGIASVGIIYYLYCTIRGTVQPNKVTWFFWGAFPMIAFFAQMSQQVGVIAWATFAAGFTPFLVVFAATMNPDAYWKIKPIDYMFAAVAIIGVILWQVTDNANIALTFALLADLMVAFPTLIKAYTNPETEDWKAYAFTTVGFLIALLSVSTWTYENYAFVLYLFFLNALVMVLAARKPTQAPKVQEVMVD